MEQERLELEFLQDGCSFSTIEINEFDEAKWIGYLESRKRKIEIQSNAEFNKPKDKPRAMRKTRRKVLTKQDERKKAFSFQECEGLVSKEHKPLSTSPVEDVDESSPEREAETPSVLSSQQHCTQEFSKSQNSSDLAQTYGN